MALARASRQGQVLQGAPALQGSKDSKARTVEIQLRALCFKGQSI